MKGATRRGLIAAAGAMSLTPVAAAAKAEAPTVARHPQEITYNGVTTVHHFPALGKLYHNSVLNSLEDGGSMLNLDRLDETISRHSEPAALVMSSGVCSHAGEVIAHSTHISSRSAVIKEIGKCYKWTMLDSYRELPALPLDDVPDSIITVVDEPMYELLRHFSEERRDNRSDRLMSYTGDGARRRIIWETHRQNRILAYIAHLPFRESATHLLNIDAMSGLEFEHVASSG